MKNMTTFINSEWKYKMATLTPYIGKSNDRLTKLINADNRSNLVEGTHFTYGEPEAFTDAEGRNTKIKLIPVPGSKYKQEADVFYTRLELSVLADLPAGSLSKVKGVTFPTTIHAILPKINAALGLTLTADEVADAALPAEVDEATLTILANCKAWIEGSSYTFAIQNGEDPEDKEDLADVISNDRLSGLEFIFE